MNLSGNQSVQVKQYLNCTDYEEIKKLQEICRNHDKTELKLELDYKLGRAEGKIGIITQFNEFMYFDENTLIGYIGIGHYGGDAIEVNGMVHPANRRQGVFSMLYTLVASEFQRRMIGKMLLLSDANSMSGQAFINSIGAKYQNSEYEMYMTGQAEKIEKSMPITLRKACNADASEIAKQNSIYFGKEINPSEVPLPEEEEKCGMECFIAEFDGKIIGKVNLEIRDTTGAIFGLGVLPEFRGKGYGRELLRQSTEKLKQRNAKNIMLQVAVENKNALGLYKSCGFVETSTMDYFLLTK